MIKKNYGSFLKTKGINCSPVGFESKELPELLFDWQKDIVRWAIRRGRAAIWASPIWMDINPSDTLQKESAREEKDEKHIAPLQLEVIRRCITLWSNPGDILFSPFSGIGSEGYMAIKMGRKFKGVELKKSYWEQGNANLKKCRNRI